MRRARMRTAHAQSAKRVKSKEQRAKSKEQRAKSKEQKATRKEIPHETEP